MGEKTEDGGASSEAGDTCTDQLENCLSDYVYHLLSCHAADGNEKPIFLALLRAAAGIAAAHELSEASFRDLVKDVFANYGTLLADAQMESKANVNDVGYA